MKGLKFTKNLSITYKLVGLFLLIGIGSASTIGYYAYIKAKNALIERTLNQLNSIMLVNKYNLELFFKERKRDLNILSHNIENEYNHSADLNKRNEFLTRLIKQYIYCNSLLIINNNTLVYEYNCQRNNHDNNLNPKALPTSLQEIIAKVQDNKDIFIYEGKYFAENSDTFPAIFIGKRLKLNNIENKIFAIMVYPLTSIHEVLMENKNENGFGNTGETYLVGSDYLMRSHSRFFKESLLKTIVKTEATIAIKDTSIHLGIIKDYRNVDVLSASSKLKVTGLNWYIVAEIDVAEAMIPIMNIRKDIIFITIVLFLFVIAFAVILSQSITMPIKELKNAITKVEIGNFNQELKVKSEDETGVLTASFNNMLKQLQIMTNELHEREERLSHFYNATTEGIIFFEKDKPLLFNQAISKLTNYQQNEINEISINQYIPTIKDIVKKIETEQQNSIYTETEIHTKDHNIKPIEIILKKIEFKGTMVYTAILRDISIRKAIEKDLMKERMKQLSALIDGQELERQRVSRELHDGLGQQLIALKLNLEKEAQTCAESSKERINQMMNALNQIINELRNISEGLMPPILKEFGIEVALKNICKQAEINSNTTFLFDSYTKNLSLPPKTQIYIYRIAQEAVNNIIKHAEATSATIQLIAFSDFIQLIIEDNGKGFDFQQERKQQKGNGIFNIFERVKLLGGTIHFQSANGKGTQINIKLPVNDKT